MNEATQTPYECLGGETGVRALVDRFYDLMALEPDFAGLRAMHPESLGHSRDKLFWFLSGWLGGPDLFVQNIGHPMLRARHLLFVIGAGERDQWVKCMLRAMEDVEVEEALRVRLGVSFFNTADFMRNRDI